MRFDPQSSGIDRRIDPLLAAKLYYLLELLTKRNNMELFDNIYKSALLVFPKFAQIPCNV